MNIRSLVLLAGALLAGTPLAARLVTKPVACHPDADRRSCARWQLFLRELFGTSQP